MQPSNKIGTMVNRVLSALPQEEAAYILELLERNPEQAQSFLQALAAQIEAYVRNDASALQKTYEVQRRLVEDTIRKIAA